ncbi:MAG TPA: hypothetical protein VFC42_13710 [Methylomirabilota bacterium]|jgi:hypothetical protein|nr:hypothetical protein [Methylomirabilota bacterium]
MRMLGRVAVTALLTIGLAIPALARVAAIRTAAPITEHSDQGVRAAFAEAVESAVRGAIAMGMSHVALNDARVLEDVVLVEILATDAPGSDAPTPTPPAPNDEDGDHASGIGAAPALLETLYRTPRR